MRIVSDQLARADARVDWSDLKAEAMQLQEELKSDVIWQEDAPRAIKCQKRLSVIDDKLSEYNGFVARIQECSELLELAISENDSTIYHDIFEDLGRLETELSEYLYRLMMTGECDRNGCFIEIRAGSGGTESCDWVQMLSRMYERWAISRSYEVKLVDDVKGDQAGLKSATLQVNGEYAYGLAQHESGVHRFVRVSPFDANGKRHTSFVSVQVYPAGEEGDGDNSSSINEADLKIEYMRSSGAGGQHVNKTESAVRIVHIPTGITVQCQNERSQHSNRATALRMLAARLLQREMQTRAKERADRHEVLPENAWGSQIRSYVLQPYQMVKDLRTGLERSDVGAILDGDINSFLEASLMHSSKNK
ncbi:hypothetical protein BJ742DRAFT_900680 [Cladochytrium replicatum]|nr:hypothetical protein BJ742DRAFT_900680 [Cladochytrium replicatum]